MHKVVISTVDRQVRACAAIFLLRRVSVLLSTLADIAMEQPVGVAVTKQIQRLFQLSRSCCRLTRSIVYVECFERWLTSGAEPKVGFPTERTNVVLTNALGITEGIYEHLRGAYDVVYAQSIALSELPLDHHVLALRYMYSGFRVVFEVRSYLPVDGRSQRYSW